MPLESIKSLPAPVEDMIFAFGHVEHLRGSESRRITLKMTDNMSTRTTFGISKMMFAGNYMFLKMFGSQSLDVYDFNGIFKFSFATPRKFEHFIISFLNEIYILDYTYKYIYVFDLNGELKRSWPKFAQHIQNMWNYDQQNILIIFRGEKCAHVYDRNGSFLYTFGNQNGRAISSTVDNVNLGFRKIMIVEGWSYNFYSNEKCVFKYPLKLFNTYYNYNFQEYGYFAVSPLGEIYHFLEDKRTSFTTVTVYRFENNILTTPRQFQIVESVSRPFVFSQNGLLCAVTKSSFLSEIVVFK